MRSNDARGWLVIAARYDINPVREMVPSASAVAVHWRTAAMSCRGIPISKLSRKVSAREKRRTRSSSIATIFVNVR